MHKSYVVAIVEIDAKSEVVEGKSSPKTAPNLSTAKSSSKYVNVCRVASTN
jgi:hypothetical protein